MNKNIPVLEVDESIARATNGLAGSMEGEINLIKVDPPEDQGEGMEGGGNFLESVHFLDMNNRLIRSNKNESPTCGMEMWYENNKIKFVFYLPSEDLEQEYRQQLRGYYEGADVSSKTSEEGMFIKSDPEMNEAVAVTDIYLNKHYFNPIASPVSEDNELENDPYQRIVNDLDTKDNTRAMLQFLYKPVNYGWTDMQHETLETYAKKVQQKGGYKTKWFGLKIEEVDDTSIWENAAAEIRSRKSKPSYFVNARLAIIARGQTQEQANQKAQSRLTTTLNSIERLYSTKSEQKLVPRDYGINQERNAKETLMNMIERNPTNMSQERRIHKLAWEKLTSKTSTIILTADELSGLIHLPSSDEVQSDAVSWSDQMVSGKVPPDIKDFNPVSKEDQDSIDIPEVEDENGSDDEEEENSDDSKGKSALFGR